MSSVTAVILTYNEEPNITRVLNALTWCERIVVLDSGSSDQTKARALTFSTVSWFNRPFDTHANQWRFAIFETGIKTDLVLALDSDMIVPSNFVDEIKANFRVEHAGGILPFHYCSLGRILKGSLYPAQLRLLRPSQTKVVQRGHTQEFLTDGPVYTFRACCIHDDRKPLERWLNAQVKYSSLELQRIASSPNTTLKDHLRKLGLMPIISGILAYCRAGGPFMGKAALNYAYERMSFESILTLQLLRTDVNEANVAEP